jgi:protein ImuB
MSSNVDSPTPRHGGRYACLYVPDLPLAAALRTEPELAGRPLAILESRPRTGMQPPVIVAGWMRGMTEAQARAVEPELVVRPLSLEGLRSTRRALLDVAGSFGPRVEEAEPGCAHLDLAGLGVLFPSESGLLTALEKRLGDTGLGAARLGIGPTRTVARLAARHRCGGAIVAESRMRAFLDPLPLDLLDPPGELADRLWSWGVHTLGELGRLPPAALGARLGEEGVRLARRARGEDLAPFRAVPPEPRFEEGAESYEHPIDHLDALAFLLRGVLERLTHRLRLCGRAARALRLELDLEDGRRLAREIDLAAATDEAPVIGSLVRLALERDPPPAPIERVRAIATAGNVEAAQLDLFLPPLPAPAELAATVARLEALCGPAAVGAPRLDDTHRLDAAPTERFAVDPRRTPAAPASAPTPPDRAALALRALRPPCAVRVWGDVGPERIHPLVEDAPASRDARFRGGRVLHRAGPWRLVGEWWGESPFARDYYDVELSDGGVYRLYRNAADESWFVDGVYD